MESRAGRRLSEPRGELNHQPTAMGIDPAKLTQMAATNGIGRCGRSGRGVMAGRQDEVWGPSTVEKGASASLGRHLRASLQ